MDCSSPGCSVHGTLQARILEWVAVPFSMATSQPRDQTQVSPIAGRFFTSWAIREAQYTRKSAAKFKYRPWHMHECDFAGGHHSKFHFPSTLHRDMNSNYPMHLNMPIRTQRNTGGSCNPRSSLMYTEMEHHSWIHHRFHLKKKPWMR